MAINDADLAQRVISTCRLDYLTPPQQTELLRHLRLVRLPELGYLLQEGNNVPDSLAFIMQGRLNASKTTEGGKHQIVLGVFGPGSIVGDLWHDESEPAAVSLQAIEPVEFCLMRSGSMEDILRNHVDLGLLLLKRFQRDYTSRMRFALERLAGLF